MPIDPGALQYVQEQLLLVEPVTVKRMFGGAGFYAQGHFFALMDDDTLYFKVDDSNRSDYLAAGSPPFAPWGEEGLKLEYYEVPDLIIDNLSRLKVWMQKSIAVAMAAKERKLAKKHKPRKTAILKKKRAAAPDKLGKLTKPQKTATKKKAVGKAPSNKKVKRKST
jgi:DNA transformation protein and related proteins